MSPGRLPSVARVLVVQATTALGVRTVSQLQALGVFVDGPVGSGADAVARLREARPDLIFMDVHLPGGTSGIDAAHIIRTAHDVPIVFLTSETDAGIIAEAAKAAPFGYVLMPSSESHLRAAIEVALNRFEAEQRLKRTWEHREAALVDEASRDPLTGAWNRRRITDILDAELARVRREGSSLAVLMIDADDLKRVNDRFGHASGDIVLKEIVRRITAHVRPSDALGRLGGDEFLLVWSSRHDKVAINPANRIIEAVHREPVSIGSRHIHARISVGAELYGPDDDRDQHRLIAAADAALYRAKQRHGLTWRQIGEAIRRAGRQSPLRWPTGAREVGKHRD